MATAFSINQYRDPGHVDMSATFKAQTYKQQLYDTNVAQTQQLINQFFHFHWLNYCKVSYEQIFLQYPS